MFYKINEQCFGNLIAINNSLEDVETRRESTMLLANIRKALGSILEQMKSDNQPEEESSDGGVGDG